MDNDKMPKYVPECAKCWAALLCLTGMVREPRRCHRCRCVEATLANSIRRSGIFKVGVEGACPRVEDGAFSDTGFYCIDCALLIDSDQNT